MSGLENIRFQCIGSFKDHVEPSSKVLGAIQEVEESLDKTTFAKVMIWIKLFLSSFLMPLGIMISDISFDVILVVGYAVWLVKMDDTISATDTKGVCEDLNNSTHGMEIIHNLKKLENAIPSGLGGRPRFFYSTSFVALPWFFYGIEFCHSRHLSNTINAVKRNQKYNKCNLKN